MKSYTQKGGLLLMIESRELWTLRPKLWTSQIWTLINNFIMVLICTKCAKLITLEKNIISVQQLLLCLPLFFVFSSEVLNSGIKSCYDGVVFQVAVCEECFSIRLRCPVGNYMFKVNNRNIRAKCEICSKLTIKTPERCHWRRSGVFIVNFEHISYLALMFLLLTLNK